MWSTLKRVRHGQRGMSLVEMMVVVAIMAVVMMAVMGLYVPAQRSTVVQTQLSDIQSDLRLALKTMTNDLLSAGFLVTGNSAILATSDHDFTIRSRIIGGGYARVSTVTNTATLSTVPIASADMADGFPDNSYVRIFDGVRAVGVDEGSTADKEPDESKRVYQVVSTTKDTVNDTATFEITDPNSGLQISDIDENDVIVRVRDVSQPAIHEIRYLLSGDSLERHINNTQVQILARNLDLANSSFLYESPNLVKIKLTGKTRALQTAEGPIEKSRGIETSVKLRNVR